MRCMRFLTALAAFAFTATLTQQSLAQSSSTITPTSTGALNTYALSLTDSSASSTPIQTFWFAWIDVPNTGFLPTPLSTALQADVTSPPGWTPQFTNSNTSIRWILQAGLTPTQIAADEVSPGETLSGFGFTTADSPAVLAGNSTAVPADPILTSFTYSAGPFVGTAEEFVVAQTSVPEPASLALLTPAAMLMLRRNRR